MRPKTISITPVVDRDGVYTSARPASSGAITLAGALVSGTTATFATPQHVSIYAGTNESTITFTVTGTDRYGAALTEDITGPNATTVYGSKNFKTITSVSCSARPSNVIEVGIGNRLESQPVPIGKGLSYAVEIGTAVATHTFQYTLQNPFDSDFNEHTATWFEDQGSTNQSVDGSTGGDVGAVRLKIDSWTSGTVTFRIFPERFGA